ncbi:MAG: FAD-binding protein, partial [Gammaproteobacteria bacterium]|nr:FAD-binding protein [Gammaproteobacteria bacterium]
MGQGDLSSRDRRLGIGEPITRRDFIGSTLVGAGATLLSGCAPLATTPQAVQTARLHPWDGYGGVGDYATSNGNTQAVMDAAHVLRDGGQAGALAAASPTGETFDLVVVGGGFAGLAAAFQFHAGIGGKTCLVLDNHPVFGGEAK